MRDKNPQVYLAPITNKMEMHDIEERFLRYGPIRDIQIKRGYGFIEFEHHRDADEAIHDMHGQKFRGERMTVEPAGIKRRKPRGPQEDDVCFNCRGRGHWYVKGLETLGQRLPLKVSPKWCLSQKAPRWPSLPLKVLAPLIRSHERHYRSRHHYSRSPDRDYRRPHRSHRNYDDSASPPPRHRPRDDSPRRKHSDSPTERKHSRNSHSHEKHSESPRGGSLSPERSLSRDKSGSRDGSRGRSESQGGRRHSGSQN